MPLRSAGTGWRHRVVELRTLEVDGDPARKVAEAAGVIVVKVADTNRSDLLETDPHRIERVEQRVPIAGGQRGHNPGLCAMEAAAKRRVADQARVETGIEQQPPAVDLDQHPWDRLDEPLLGRRAVHRPPLRGGPPSRGSRARPA